MTTNDRISVSLETITPDCAKEMLDKHTGGRHLKIHHINKLADAMKNGKWIMNGEAIKITSDDQVVDGLHRLFACIQADVPFETVVVRGIDPSMFEITTY